MRQIVSLSLSLKDAQCVKTMTKTKGFRSVSSFITHLIRSEENVISEKELLKTVRKARRDYKAGRLIRASSMADLLK